MALRNFAAQTATALRVRCGPRVHAGFSVSLFRSMSTVLENLKYSKSHEWVKLDGDAAFVGITDHAQAELGDIVHFEVSIGINEGVTKGEPMAVVESVKAASDVYAPISGSILEVNAAVKENPALVNDSPFEEGWFAKIKLTDPSELDALLTPQDYEAHVAASAH